jgi:hypothetical protein
MATQQPLKLSGNVLDVAYAGNGDLLLISVDGVHDSGSTQTWRSNITGKQVFVEGFVMRVLDGKLTFEPSAAQIIDNINTQGTDDILKSTDEGSRTKERKVLNEALYNIENLRKRNQVEET